MRKELYDLERIEKFLEGDLTSAENTIFKNNLETDGTLRTNLKAFELLQIAAKRRALRQKFVEIENGPKGNSWGGVLGILAILAIAITVFIAWPDEVEEQSIVGKNSTETTTGLVPDSVLVKAKAIPTKEGIGKSTDLNLKTWIEPFIQNFSFDSEKGAFIEGKNGLIVVVPKDAFVNSNGKNISGVVEFQLIEALTIKEMVLYGLKTVSPDGLLASGGMFYLNAKIDGEKVEINPSKPLYIEVPSPKLEDKMMAFEGRITKEGDLSWEKPRPLKKPLVTLPVEELDFLPEGFEKKVHSLMPALGYKKANDKIVDSLYFSLVWDNSLFEERRSSPRDLLIGEDSFADTATTGCGINPASIESVLTKRFENSFIATKDFERRVSELHQLENGQDLFDIYLANLDKDLYISDSICSRLLQETEGVFRDFYLEKAANVKDSELYANQLRQHYLSESRKLKERKQKLYDSKIEELRKKSTDNVSLGNAEVAALRTAPAYSTQWFTLGWGNIDRYFKELNEGSKYVNINVKDQQENLAVTAWLPRINTYTDLNEISGRYRALYPADFQREVFVFTIAKSGDQFFWDFEKFKPSQKSEIELNPKLVSVAKIKTDLAEVGESWGRVSRERARIEKEKARIQQSIQTFYRQNKSDNGDNQRATTAEAKYHRLICQLKSVAFPCDCEQEKLRTKTIQLVEAMPIQVFTIVEEMPSFPGGDDELKRYLTNNLEYPRQALENKIEGTVYVTFIVRANGTISNPEILRSIGYGCDEAALNAIRKMPRWNPGQQRGQDVDVQYNIPVDFSLGGDGSF